MSGSGLLALRWPRLATLALSLAACLVLAGCVFAPGRFTSSLDLRQDGRFRFIYAGEIHMLPLTELARQAETDPFAPSPCYAPDSGEERPCTRREIAEQEEAWRQGREADAERRKRDAEMTRSVLGGIDPQDPGSAEELAARLRRQTGWKRVDYKGDGLFIVEFDLSGRLDHDFVFPSIERFPATNPFVTLSLRQDGSVRVDAPGLAAPGAGAPLMALPALATLGAKGKDKPGLPVTEGDFVLTTDGAILANNTEAGPEATTTGQQLTWRISGSSAAAAPMALVKRTP